MSMKPDELFRKWQQRVPQDGADCEEVIAVMRYLGMEVELRKKGHWTGKHPKLVGSVSFPQGVITVNCHAFGKQGKAHPAAIRDVLRAAKVIQEEDTNE
jgi:hypothetical protein